MLSGYIKRLLLLMILCVPVAFAQGGQYTSIAASPEPLPPCVPSNGITFQPMIWDATAALLKVCTAVNTWTAITGGGGGGATIQVNGTNTASQTLINFVNGNPFNGLTPTFTNTGFGVIQLGFTGTLGDAGITGPYSGTGTCATSTWAKTLNRNVAPTCTQPAFTDIAAQIALTQLPTIATNTFLGNITGSPATPTAVLGTGGGTGPLLWTSSSLAAGQIPCANSSVIMVNCTPGIPVVQLTTSGTIANANRASLGVLNSGSAIALALPAPATLPNNYFADYYNVNTGLPTFSSSGGTFINCSGPGSGTSQTVPQGWFAILYNDGANYCMPVMPTPAAIPTTTTGQALGFNGSTFTVVSSGSSVAFSAITGGTNTTAGMIVGSGATLSASGSGAITATALPVTGLTGTCSAHTFVGNDTGSSAAPTCSGIGSQDYGPNTIAAGGGTANAQTVTLPVAPSSLVTGLDAWWIPSNSSTSTAPTLAVNSLTGMVVEKSNGAALTSLSSGDILGGVPAYAKYNGAVWVLQNPQSNIAATGSTVASPQYQFPFYSSAGTVNTLTGSPNEITDSSGDFIVTTTATGSVANSPLGCLYGNYQITSGPTYGTDQWCWQDVVPPGNNPASALTLTHTGSSSAAVAVNFLKIGISGTTIQPLTATSPLTLQSGLNNTSSNQGLLSLLGGSTSGGSSAVKAGGVLIQGGTSASSNSGAYAGSVQLENGSATGGSNNGLVQVEQWFAKGGGTSTAGNIQCSVSTFTVNDCGASPTNTLCIAQSVPTGVVGCVLQGLTVVNSSNAATVTHTVCAGSTAGEVTDSGGTTACTVGTGIGVVISLSGTWSLPDGASITASSTTPLIAIVRN
jgi:hypothetical protein